MLFEPALEVEVLDTGCAGHEQDGCCPTHCPNEHGDNGNVAAKMRGWGTGGVGVVVWLGVEGGGDGDCGADGNQEGGTQSGFGWG